VRRLVVRGTNHKTGVERTPINMTDIIDSPCAGNGAGDTPRKKFRLLDKLMGDGRLTDAERRVGYFIIDWYGIKGPYTFTRHDRLAERAGVSEKTVQRAVARLVAVGYIFVKTQGRHGRASEYVPVFLTEQPLAGHSEQPLGGHSYVHLSRTQLCPPKVDIAMSTHTLPPRSDNEGVVGTDAGALAPDGARARAGRAASEDAASKKTDAVPAVLKQLLSVWQNKPAKSVKPAKRVIAEVMARDDAPAIELLLAKAREYVANVPPGEQRWLHIWLQDEGWTCDERPRMSERASKANGKAEPCTLAGSLAARFPIGTRVREPDSGVCARVVAHRPEMDEENWEAGQEEDEPVRLVWDDGRSAWYGQMNLDRYQVVGASKSAKRKRGNSKAPVADDEPSEFEDVYYPGRTVWDRRQVDHKGRVLRVETFDDGSCHVWVWFEESGCRVGMPPADLVFEDPYTPEQKAEIAKHAVEAKAAAEAKKAKLEAEAEEKRKAEAARQARHAAACAKFAPTYRELLRRFPIGSRVDLVLGYDGGDRYNGEVLSITPDCGDMEVLWEGETESSWIEDYNVKYLEPAGVLESAV
jgi:hypothetical protein